MFCFWLFDEMLGGGGGGGITHKHKLCPDEGVKESEKNREDCICVRF